MSDTIDNRIVSLEFDNSKYDKNVNKSIKTTEKLEDALEFKGVESNFNKLNKTIAKVTFSPIEKGIDSVYAKFTMLERFTIQAYDRIANRIIDIGKNIMNEAFTVPRKSGLTEYEQKMDAIQVMLAGSGESLDTINAKLAELNKYADDTIYSFSDMTQNVGKFINAGVSLDDAVIAIKGISNEAALSGANAQEASRAMYNLAQSLSMGYVATKDWLSIENANMATMSFKEQIIETAEELGVLSKVGNGVWQTADGLQVTAENLRETLSGKWLSSDVLIKTLTKYGDSTTDIGKKASQAATEVRTFSKMVDTLKEALQSGWGNTWELIIGNFEEAKALWTSISNVLGGMIDKMASSRNEMVKLWKESGGRTAALNGFANAWKNLTAILGAIREAFRTVFPPMTGDKLAEFSIKFEKLTRKLTPSAQTLDKVKRAFTGLFSVLGIVSDAAKAFVSALVSVFSHIKKTDGGLLSAAASLGDWLTNLRQTIKEGRVFETVFGGLAKGLSVAINAVKMIGKFIKDLILAFKEKGFTGAFEVIKHGFSALVNHISDELNSFNPIDKVKEIGKNIASTIENWPVIGTVYKFLVSIKNAFANSNVFSFIVDLFKGLVNGVKNAINEFRNVDTSATDDFTDRLSKKFEPIMGAFTILKNFLANFFKLVKSLLKFIGVVGAQIFDVLSNVFDTLTNSFGDMTAKDAGITFATGSLGVLLLSIAKGMKSISGILGNVQSITGNIAKCFNALTTMINAEALSKIAKAIAILTASLLVLSAIPVNQLSAATAVITALFFNLMNIMKSYARAMGMTSKLSVGAKGLSSEGSGGALAGMGAQLLLIADAIAILVAAMAVISLLDYESLVKGTAVLILLLEAITSMSKQLMHGYDITSGDKSSSTKALKMGGNLLALGLTISMIVGVFIKLLVVLAIMNKVAGQSQTLKLLTEAGVILGLMMGGIAVILMAVGKAVEFTSKAGTETKGAAAGGGALIGTILAVGFMITQIVGAFTIMLAAIAALYQLGDIDALDKTTETMLKLGAGLLLFIVAIAGIVTGFSKINNKGLKPGDAVTSIGSLVGIILVIMNALTVLMAAVGGLALIAHLDPMSFEETRTTILSIMGALVAIIVALTAKDLVAKGNGIESVKKFAVGILAFAAAISIMAGAFTEVSKLGWKDILKAAGAITFVMGVLAGFGEIIGNSDKMAKGIGKLTGLLKGLAVVIGIVAASFLAVQLALKILSSFTDEELVAAEENLSEFLKYMKSAAPEFAEAIAAVLAGVLQMVLESMFSLVSEQVDQIMSFLLTTLEQLVQYAPAILANIMKLIIIVLDAIGGKAPEIIDRLVVTLVSIINGLAAAIDEHRKEILDAVDRLFDSVSRVIVEGYGRLLGLSGSSLDKFVTNWDGAISKILKIATMAFVGSKIAGGAQQMIKSIKDAIFYLQYFAFSAKEAGGVIPMLTEAFNSKLGTSFTSVGPMMAAVAAAMALRVVIQKLSDEIDVTNGYNEELKESYDSLREARENYVNSVNERKATATDVDATVRASEIYLDKLKDIMDANGKINKEHEKEAEIYLKEINEALGTNYEILDGQLILYNEQGEAIAQNAAALDEMFKKRKYEMKIEALEDSYKEALQLGDRTNVNNELVAQLREAQNELKMAEDSGNEELALNASKKVAAINRQIESYKDFAQTYEKALQAYATGDEEDMEKYDRLLSSGINVDTSNVDTLYWQLHEAQDQYQQYMKDVEDGLTEYSKDTEETLMQNMQNLYDQLASVADENSETLEGYNVYNYLMNDDFVDLGLVRQNVQDVYATAIDEMSKNKKELLRNSPMYAVMKETEKWTGQTGAADKWLEEESKVSSLESHTINDRAKRLNYQNEINHVRDILKDTDWTSSTDVNVLGNAMYNMTEAAKKEMISQYPEMEKVFNALGEYGGAGFADGLFSTKKEVKDDTIALAEIVEDSFKDEFKIASPSKVTKEFGEYVVEGLILGMQNQAQEAAKVATSIANTVLTAMALPTQKGFGAGMASSIFSAGFQGIVPVEFDTRSAIAGLDSSVSKLSVPGIFGNGIDIAASGQMTAQLADSQYLQAFNRSQNDILDAMTFIQEEIADLKDEMMDISIVMDSGALVGSIAGQMDSALGRRASIKRRGG